MAKKTPSRVRPTEAYLLNYSAEHVPYEIGMLMCSHRFKFSKTKIEWDLPAPESLLKKFRHWTVEMALLEALALHSRNLLEFLYSPRPRGDDVIAEDFFDDPEEWKNTRPELSDRLKKFWKRVDKEVAHLTKKRIAGTPPEKYYHPEEFEELFEVLRLFAKYASPSRLHQQVRDRVLEL